MRQAKAVPAARFVLAAICIYVALDVILVFLRPQFSVLDNAESDYGSRGPWGWLMDVNFLLRCLLSLGVVVALTHALDKSVRSTRLRFGAALVVLWAVASGLLALFPDDPAGTRTHWTGAVHLALASVAFVAILAGSVLLSASVRSHREWGPVAIPMAVCAWAALVPLLLLAHSHLRPGSLGGLYEKIFLGMELFCLALMVMPVAFQPRLDHGTVPDRAPTVVH